MKKHIVSMIPCIILKNTPVDAIWFAFFSSFAPIEYAIIAFKPIPKPTAIALIIFCTGNTIDKAVIAF